MNTSDKFQNYSPLLINDKVLTVLPDLAVCLGLNEAIIVQQVHYWLKKSEHEHYGKKWVYNTYAGWNEQFPFWSISTIRRTISNLEKSSVLKSRMDLNTMKIDKTKWYTIDYDKLNSMSSPCVQYEQTSCSKWTDASVQNEQTNNHRLPETTSYNKDIVPKNGKKMIKIEPQLKCYARYVFMIESEYSALVKKYGHIKTKEYIYKLDNYKGATGKKYKSDYRAILSWVVDSVGAKTSKPVGERAKEAGLV